MSIILDLIVIAIIILMVLISAKRGFVRVAVEAVGFVAAIILSLSLSTTLADVTYQKAIEPAILSSVENATAETTSSAADDAWNSLPELITKNADKFGISKDSITNDITEDIGNSATEIVTSISQNTIKPMAVGILKTLYSVILMLVLMIAVKFLARVINKLFSFSLVGKVNKALGGTFGAIKGIIIAWVFCAVISLLVSLTKNGIWIFNAENIENTIIFKILTEVIKFKETFKK